VNSGAISYRQEKILQFPPQISYRQEFHFWNCQSRDNQSADFQDLTDFTRAIGEISSDSHPQSRVGRNTAEGIVWVAMVTAVLWSEPQK
jgi:hypothetical protein